MHQPITGVQRVARELTREVDRLIGEGDDRFRTRFVCRPGADVHELNLKNIAIQEVDGPKGFVWEQYVLPRVVGDASLLCLGNTAPITSLLRKRSVALMIHDLSYRQFPKAYRYRYRLLHSIILPLLLNRANPIITVSNSEQQMLAKLVPKAADRIIVAPNGGWRQDDALPIQHVPDDKDGYALYVGSFSQRKNFVGTLEVAIRLAREDGLRFKFVGSTGSILVPTLRDLPEDVRDKIVFLGQIHSQDELARIYREARCLVFPSFYEASPLPPLEAMHFGCPVVVSSIPAMRERCGDAAEYCDPYDIESILAAVRRVIYDRDRVKELTTKGFAWERNFSWRSQAKLVLDAIWASHSKAV